MIITAIVATDMNNAIGKNNQLLWNMPAELKFFKTTTMGCPVIMGRKTYDSMGRALPGRKNIVITRNTDYKLEDADVYHSVEDAVKACKHLISDPSQRIFIIGGAEIFKQSFRLTDEVYRTLIKSSFDADTFIPDISEAGFNMVSEDCHNADEKNKFDYCFQKWEKAK